MAHLGKKTKEKKEAAMSTTSENSGKGLYAYSRRGERVRLYNDADTLLYCPLSYHARCY